MERPVLDRGLLPRTLGVDYRDDGIVYDVVQHGRYLGAIFSF